MCGSTGVFGSGEDPMGEKAYSGDSGFTQLTSQPHISEGKCHPHLLGFLLQWLNDFSLKLLASTIFTYKNQSSFQREVFLLPNLSPIIKDICTPPVDPTSSISTLYFSSSIVLVTSPLGRLTTFLFQQHPNVQLF